MATTYGTYTDFDTCTSVIVFTNPDDKLIDPFFTERNDKAYEMNQQGKTSRWPNWIFVPDASVLTGPYPGLRQVNGKRSWIDQAAAQEFLDHAKSLAESYNISISTAIEGYDNTP
jgi:hypothetical protein